MQTQKRCLVLMLLRSLCAERVIYWSTPPRDHMQWEHTRSGHNQGKMNFYSWAGPGMGVQHSLC